MSETEKEVATRRLHGLLTKANYEVLWDNLAELSVIYEKSMDTAETLKDTKSGNFGRVLSPKAQSMVKSFAYLGLVESLGVTLVDMVLFLLIANGKEMHIYSGGGMKHVSMLKELKKLDLGYKLYFLKSHELGFFGKPINRQLRNDIAHLKFSIEQDGTIRDSQNREIIIDETITSFWRNVSDITSIFNETKFMQLIKQGAKEGEK